MENETSIATVNPISPITLLELSPKEQIEIGVECAKALKTVLDAKPKPVMFNGKRYSEYDDWQTLGKFFNVSVKTYEAEPVEIDGIKGAKSKATLIDNKTGLVIGGAEAYCMRDEKNWNTRAKYEWQGKYPNGKKVKVGEELVPWFQLASMSQTRAGAKALKNHLSWVMVLAGVSPTPAEEMDGMVEIFETETEAEPFPDVNPERKKKENSLEWECNNCGLPITKKVFDFSRSKFGKSLCFDCQKTAPKLAN